MDKFIYEEIRDSLWCCHLVTENKAAAYTRIHLRFADDCTEQESSVSTSNAFSAIDALQG